MRCILWLACLLALGSRGEDASGFRYELPETLQARFEVNPIPLNGPDGQPRPRYQWKLYGVDHPEPGSTRFLFELTILHFHRLLGPGADPMPFYHLGFFEVDRMGRIIPNPSLPSVMDPNLLFPDLPLEDDRWSTADATKERKILSRSAGALVGSEIIRDPNAEGTFAESVWTFEPAVGLVTTNTLVISKELPYPVSVTNEVRLMKLSFRDPSDGNLLSRDAPTYIQAVRDYFSGMENARAGSPDRAGTLMTAAKRNLMLARAGLMEPRLKRFLKRYEQEHAALADSITARKTE